MTTPTCDRDKQHPHAEVLPIEHDPKKLPPPIVRYCGDCGSLFRNGKWEHPKVPALTLAADLGALTSTMAPDKRAALANDLERLVVALRT